MTKIIEKDKELMKWALEMQAIASIAFYEAIKENINNNVFFSIINNIMWELRRDFHSL